MTIVTVTVIFIVTNYCVIRVYQNTQTLKHSNSQNSNQRMWSSMSANLLRITYYPRLLTLTRSMGGKTLCTARARTDLAVPLRPEMSTPPMAGLTANTRGNGGRVFTTLLYLIPMQRTIQYYFQHAVNINTY